ncbi:MAG TPA: alpha/beta hydrolase [Xanthobacteraceae bacterium]|nr:alpha/beta hydrolase [Xanthobacteraceae bacterium]
MTETSETRTAPQTKRVTGPLVYRDFDQLALDDAYDQAVYAANRVQVTGRRVQASARARKILGNPQREAYGPTEIERLDIFRTDKSDAPVNIFIHGGAWRNGEAANYAYQAEMFVRAGAHHVILDFINVDAAGGSLFPMIEQVRRAIGWVHLNARSFGGDPDRLYLTSHSSGSHLAGCALITDWDKAGRPRDIIKGALLISGMYDLEPVRLSKRSNYVTFTDAMEHELSAMRHLDRIHTPVILTHGTLETPEFQRQTRDFHRALQQAGKPAELIVAEGYNHFEILEMLANPYALLGRAALSQMGLGPKASGSKD